MTSENLRPDGEVPLSKDKVWVADVTLDENPYLYWVSIEVA